jgi:hypothetical protein
MGTLIAKTRKNKTHKKFNKKLPAQKEPIDITQICIEKNEVAPVSK